jgi:hypothetical protein
VKSTNTNLNPSKTDNQEIDKLQNMGQFTQIRTTRRGIDDKPVESDELSLL